MHKLNRHKDVKIIHAWLFDAFTPIQQIPIEALNNKLRLIPKKENIKITRIISPKTHIIETRSIRFSI